MSDKPQYGTFSLGRLKFRTAEEARGAADDLGLDDVHSHTMGDGERLFMPGENHGELTDSLTARGLDPMPGKQAMRGDAPMQTGSDGMAAMTDPDEAADMTLGIGTPSGLIGERGDETGPFNLFGDSDDDGDMEIY